MREYDKFQKGAVNGSRNTRALAENLASDAPDKRICVTTIQKLSSYLKHPDLSRKVLDRHTVFIFDECHRSQFGKMHTAITKSFRNYHLFGFTGTPIFAENAGSGTDPDLRTTAQAFGDRLHTYTVVDAISDGNVLPFKIDYVSTFRQKDTGKDVKVEAIDTDTAWQNPVRMHNVAAYILDNFDQKTRRNAAAYKIKGARRNGFNSILACDSIKSAESYYRILREMIGQRENCDLKVATIFSFAPYGADDDRNGFTGFFDRGGGYRPRRCAAGRSRVPGRCRGGLQRDVQDIVLDRRRRLRRLLQGRLATHEGGGCRRQPAAR